MDENNVGNVVPIGNGREVCFDIAGFGNGSVNDNITAQYTFLETNSGSGFRIELYRLNGTSMEQFGTLALPFCKQRGFGKVKVTKQSTDGLQVGKYQDNNKIGLDAQVKDGELRHYGLNAMIRDIVKTQKKENTQIKVEPEKGIELVRKDNLEQRISRHNSVSRKVTSYYIKNKRYEVPELFYIKATKNNTAEVSTPLINYHSFLTYRNNGINRIIMNGKECIFKYNSRNPNDTIPIKSKNKRNIFVMLKENALWILYPQTPKTEYNMNDAGILVRELIKAEDPKQIKDKVMIARREMSRSNPEADYILAIADISSGK